MEGRNDPQAYALYSLPGTRISGAHNTRQVDVHLSKQLGEYLYVFQYPLYSGSQAPYDVKYNNMACLIRPIQKKVCRVSLSCLRCADACDCK